MAVRDRPGGPDPDDWFGGSGPADLRDPADARADASAAAGDESADDWLDGEPPTTRPRASGGRTVTLGTLVAAAGVLAALILVVGLAIGGVFSGSGKKAATPPSTTPATTARTPTTTVTPPARSLPAPTTSLKPGDQGVQVKRLQRALVQLGYATGAVDGVYGPSTQTALEHLQKASALTTDGVLGPATLKALKAALKKHAT